MDISFSSFHLESGNLQTYGLILSGLRSVYNDTEIPKEHTQGTLAIKARTKRQDGNMDKCMFWHDLSSYSTIPGTALTVEP